MDAVSAFDGEEDDLFAESQETKDYPVKPSQNRNPECPLLLEKPERKTM